MLGFKRFFNARRVLAGVELVHKIIKGQFGLPKSFGTSMYGITCSPRDGCTYLQQIHTFEEAMASLAWKGRVKTT